MKRLLLIFTPILFFTELYGQHVIDLSTGLNCVKEDVPIRDIRYETSGIIVTYKFNTLSIYEDNLFPNTKNTRIKGFGVNTNIGEPAMPIRWDSYVIPNKTKYNVQVIDSTYIDFSFEMAPARPLLSLSSTTYPSINDLKIKNYTGFFPISTIIDEGVQHYRGNTLLEVGICPIKYDYTNKVIRVFK